jgi:inositol-phosphate phosphatase/L-galactose 1-phosphate phosphatase/histidinol-phosphatase
MQEFTALANMLADEAGNVVRHYFRKDFTIDTKTDTSPVTVADKAIELRLREILEKERQEDGIFGEEFGIKESRNGYTWVIDPIDGTKSFIIGRPTFGTLIALCEDERPVLGIIDQTILGERWVGIKGNKTTLNGDPVQTRCCTSLKDANAASTTPAMFKSLPPVYELFEEQTKMMAWGGDCYMYGLMALGFVDVIIEASLSPYDFCALVPVIEGAGGSITDWQGQPLTMKSDGKVIALGDPALRDETLKLLQKI